MRSMMLRRDPWYAPVKESDDTVIRSLFEELFQPLKYGGSRIYESNAGTKENPSIIVRIHEVERKYKAWREEDGSYHEELIDADDLGDLPRAPEQTE
jgi:hypothetical protein